MVRQKCSGIRRSYLDDKKGELATANSPQIKPTGAGLDINPAQGIAASSS